MYFTAILFFFTVIAIIIISYFTKTERELAGKKYLRFIKPAHEIYSGLTFSTRFDKTAPDTEYNSNEAGVFIGSKSPKLNALDINPRINKLLKLLTGLLCFVAVFIYVYFSLPFNIINLKN